jgi:hypothetical protein
MAGLNLIVGVAAAKLDLKYFAAGLGTAALFYYARRTLLSEKDSIFKTVLNKFARAFN